MGYFPVRYDSRVVIYEHKMFIRLATGANLTYLSCFTYSRKVRWFSLIVFFIFVE